MLYPVELLQSTEISLYTIPEASRSCLQFISSTPETRAICNDPYVLGYDYTEKLKLACEKTLVALREHLPFELVERESVVLNVLRGGLNFGLREAIAKGFGWNLHGSAFLSAQRARKSDNPEEWYITEATYQKIFLPDNAVIIFGDVVATGTSLEHALQKMLETVSKSGEKLRGLVFFTIGGPRSTDILEKIDRHGRERFEEYQGSAVIYFEGRFLMAEPGTPVEIKYTGTDLLRRESMLAPEFVDSQYENPAFPLERCTIYDAGSRSFRPEEYLDDVLEYWEQVLELAKEGETFAGLLASRFPELDRGRFGTVSLAEIAEKQVSRGKELLSLVR